MFVPDYDDPVNCHLGRILTLQAAHNGDTTWLVFDEERYSFSRANQLVNNIASNLADCGFRAGDGVDLMKINIEGSEFPLLERMIDCDLLGEVRCFLIQFHEWHPGAYRRRRRIQRALAKTHTKVWDYPFIWEKWQRRTQ